MQFTETGRADRDVLEESMANELAPLRGDDGDSLSPSEWRFLSVTVAAFIRREHKRPAIPWDYLVLLMGRALWSVGRMELARRLVHRHRACLVEPDAWERALSIADLAPSVWRDLIATRVVRSSALSGYAPGTAWSVDVRRALARPADRMELTLLRLCGALAAQLAGAWDASGGRGALVLRQGRHVAADLLACPVRSVRAAGLTRELRRWCVDALREIGRRRGWIAVPDVLLMD